MKKHTKLGIGLGLIVVLTAVVLTIYVPLPNIHTQEIIDVDSAPQNKGPEKIVDVTQNWEFIDVPATEWKTYSNTEYGITFQYPSHYVYDEKEAELGYFYIDFGPPYETVFKKSHEMMKAAPTFQIILKKEEGTSLAEVVEEWEKGRGREMKRTEKIETVRNIAGFPTTQVEICDPNNICSDAYYFTNGKYIFQIVDTALVGERMNRENFEKMISSFQLN